MRRLLRVALLTLAVVLTIMKGAASAQNLGHSYGAVIDTKGVVWSLEINDIFVRENTDVPFATSSGSITTAVRPGQNTMSLLFSPITGKDPATGNYVYELTEGVMIDMALTRNDFETRERVEIGLLRIRYDGAEREFVSETGSSGAGASQDGSLSSDGRYQLSELEDPKIVVRSGQTFGGFRLDVGFNINDQALPPQVWADKAVPLSDSPELRRELLRAYEEIYQKIRSGETEAIFQQAAPIWERSAFLLTDFSSARQYIESVEPGLEMFQPNRPDGATLMPLTFVTDIQGASLQFMADNQLVRVRPDPIRWENSEGEFRFSTFPVVFYKRADGSWHIGDINTGY